MTTFSLFAFNPVYRGEAGGGSPLLKDNGATGSTLLDLHL